MKGVHSTAEWLETMMVLVECEECEWSGIEQTTNNYKG